MRSPGSKHEKMIQLEFAINHGEQACRRTVFISSSACKTVHCVFGGTSCYFVLCTGQSFRSIKALQHMTFDTTQRVTTELLGNEQAIVIILFL